MKKAVRHDLCPCGSGKIHALCCPFYQAERKKIIKPVYWVQDSSLPEGIDFRCTRLRTGEQVVSLRNIPFNSQNAVKIAHELQHMVFCAEGFPGVFFNDRQFHITPKNKNGQLIGPGLGPEFKAVVEKQSLNIKVEDQLDGTYQIELLNLEKTRPKTKGKRTPVSIIFQEEPVWTSTL